MCYKIYKSIADKTNTYTRAKFLFYVFLYSNEWFTFLLPENGHDMLHIKMEFIYLQIYYIVSTVFGFSSSFKNGEKRYMIKDERSKSIGKVFGNRYVFTTFMT